MIELKSLPKREALELVRGCELPNFKTQNMKWQQPIYRTLSKEFGRKYKIPLQLIVTCATKAKKNNCTGIIFPLNSNLYTDINKKRPSNKINYKLVRELVDLMEQKNYLTILKGYKRTNKDRMTTCLRFHDKLLNNLSKECCDKWGESRLKHHVDLEVTDSVNGTKNKKVLKNLKNIRGSKILKEEVRMVNENLQEHLITYEGNTCVVVYKRRFEDDLQSGGRWYVVGTFQIESSEGRKSILIDTECTTEQDIARIHPSILATRAGFTLPDDYDPYDITPYVQTSLGFKRLRDFIKPCFMALLYANSRHTALHEIREKLWKDEEVSKHLSAETILEALEDRNFMFKDDFYNKDNWKFCQYIDSRICTKVMVHFAKQGKVCLGYHDSWIVKSQDKEELIEVITEAWEDVLGNTYNLKIEEEFDNSCIVQEKHPACEDIPIEFYEER